MQEDTFGQSVKEKESCDPQVNDSTEALGRIRSVCWLESGNIETLN